MKTIIALLILILLAGCTQQQSSLENSNSDSESSTFNPEISQQVQEISFNELCIKEKTCIQIERATTAQEQAKGLMFREILEENSGMLFLFESSSPKSFWMKNTLIPLDMIWIDKDKVITGISKNVPPCTSDPCPTYPSGEPIKFVLEVNGGFSEKNGLNAGDTVEFLD